MSRLLLRLVFLTLLASSCLVVSCAGPSAKFPAPSASWSTENGQLQYRSKAGKSMIGEVVVRRQGNSDFLLLFSSGPGIPLLKLQVSGALATAEGVFARGRWSGPVANAPANLRGWVALRDAFGTMRASEPKFDRLGWSATVEFDQQKPLHVELDHPSTGERFVFHFAR